MTEEQYFSERNRLIQDPAEIEKIEEHYAKILLNDIVLPAAENIVRDFSKSSFKLLPFWINYPPEQRGNFPTGQSTPWLELGEKTISSNIIRELSFRFDDIIFPGLPAGGDIRFATDNVYVHLDIKLTGPNDNPNEVVVPPNQVSGDGRDWNNGVMNSTHPVLGAKTGIFK